MVLLALTVWLGLGFCGCERQEVSLKKVKDCEFTVVKEIDIPQELYSVLEEKKKEPFRLSYTTGEDLYLAVGYGKQYGGGYSICVKKFYETKKNIYLETNLIGSEGITKTEVETYPYIVLKIEDINKEVIYET